MCMENHAVFVDPLYVTKITKEEPQEAPSNFHGGAEEAGGGNVAVAAAAAVTSTKRFSILNLPDLVVNQVFSCGVAEVARRTRRRGEED
mmetsp:Transcript_50352/g.162978  ORF Transcript_50352/g.162978 Transcript_50352/m.162978 type:complete len:89 (+) Transcript_50352:94-360(+)